MMANLKYGLRKAQKRPILLIQAKNAMTKTKPRKTARPSLSQFQLPHSTMTAMEHRPTREQLKAHFISTAVPLVGFGFMDQTILLQTGNAIDCTFGVWFGCSTLAAAAGPRTKLRL